MSYKEQLALQIKPGISGRSDFPLIPSKTALLVIDIQDHLSSPTTYMAHFSQENDSNLKENYLFSTALPKALPNMVHLVDTFRSIRDESRNNNSIGLDENESSYRRCEVIFTYLESLTTNNRDISLDYKLSGKMLSNLPNPTHKATFHTVSESLQPNPTLGEGDILLPKTSCSVFTSTNINYVLRNLNIEQLVIIGQLTDQCVMSAVRDGADLGYFISVVEDACAALSVDDHERGIAGMAGFARVVTTSDVLKEIKMASKREVGTSKAISDVDVKPNVEASPLRIKNVPSSRQSTTNTSSMGEKLSLCSIKGWKQLQSQDACIEALLHTLQYANIKFLRYASIDITNSIRTKVIPIQNLLQRKGKIHDQVSIAKVCMGGLPSYGDIVIPETNLSARHVLIVQPDISSLRILPYTSSSAMVFGTLHKRRKLGSATDDNDNLYGEVSEYCTRSLLQRVLQTAKDDLGIAFGVGAEIEFILVRRRNKDGLIRNAAGDQNFMDGIEPIDSTVFASSTTLNEQDDFINSVYECLNKQNIDIETLHSESAPGQMEIVLPYQTNVIKLADMVILTRETIKVCANKYGLHALFLPKVFKDSAGNGMHVHLSLSSLDNPNNNIFPYSSEKISSEVHDNRDSKRIMSDTGESFLEGILCHLKGLMGLTMPTENSFRRVGPGNWTGHSVAWMVEEKECPLRVCLDLSSSKATNVEYKLMDSSCNIYLALAGILFAGMEGIYKNMKLRPMMMSGINVDDEVRSTSHLNDKENMLPTSLEESLNCLSNDALFMELLGENLRTSYVAVKKAEAIHFKQKSLNEEVEEAMKR